MLSFCGIDVSKDRLDVMVLPEEQCCSVPNDASGWAALVERLQNFSIMAIGLEASGGYERGVARRAPGSDPRCQHRIAPKCDGRHILTTAYVK